MAEILVKAINANNTNPVKDRRGCYKRGYPVVVMSDGHPWGLQERLPLFVVIKVPLISVDRILKYIEAWRDVNGITIQRRRWRIRWSDLPPATQTKLQTDGILIIKATTTYTGPFDYTWNQVKTYFRNDETGLDEIEELA